jgi:hypothetical protein
MTPINRKKRKISITVSQQLQSKINNLIKMGKFSSTSDIINISTAQFIGKIESSTNTNSIINSLTTTENSDHSKKENISISFSEYLIDELDTISEIFDRPKSSLIRLGLIDFFEKYNQDSTIAYNPEDSKNNMPTTPEELERFIIDTLKKFDQT